jgi:predicted HAD superfamily Cof-like phosphohydrolase
MFKRVADFHRTFNQLIASSAQFPKSSVRELRHSLLKEEVDEFSEAYEANDIVEQADALADMLYIIAGTCVSYGICPTDHWCNKEELFESPYDHPTHTYKGITLFYNKKLNAIVQEDFQNYVDAEGSNNLELVKESLLVMITTIYGIAYHLLLPLNAIFAEVHRSNMEKALPDGTVLRRPDGKILKSPDWTPPDIKSILDLNKV